MKGEIYYNIHFYKCPFSGIISSLANITPERSQSMYSPKISEELIPII
jgi:hypothetical protein